MNRPLLHLVLIPGIGRLMADRLLAGFPEHAPEYIYSLGVPELVERGFTSDRARALVAALRDTATVDRELEAMERSGSRFIAYTDAEYPLLLHHMRAAPVGLFVQGVVPHHDKMIAFVGSRQAGVYGKQAVDALVTEVAQNGWCIVSGGALGIDSFAHAAALAAGGATIAVIGSGLGNPYPATNRRLFNSIIASGGAVMSPFPTMMGAVPGNFAARNGVIAGMARASVVVQAAVKSGALITAAAAAAEGREVMAVPGSIFDPLSAGCHKLLAEGASPISCAREILQLLGDVRSLPGAVLHDGTARGDTASDGGDRQQALVFEDPFIAFCRVPRTIDALLEHERCSESALYQQLWTLQVEGKVREVAAGRWQSC